jgi:competence protein ComEA
MELVPLCGVDPEKRLNFPDDLTARVLAMDPAPIKPDVHPPLRRNAQLALAVFLGVLLGLLAFRGYGNQFGTRPSEVVSRNKTRLDLNSADRAELAQVPGIGAEKAKAIEEHRQSKGKFTTVEELRDVKGFGDKTLDKVRPFLRVENVANPPNSASSGELEPAIREPKSTPVRPASTKKLQPGDPPINVNTATLQELEQLPGVGAVTANSIIASRPFRSFEDLDRVKGIGPKTLEKLRPFVVIK